VDMADLPGGPEPEQEAAGDHPNKPTWRVRPKPSPNKPGWRVRMTNKRELKQKLREQKRLLRELIRSIRYLSGIVEDDPTAVRTAKQLEIERVREAHLAAEIQRNERLLRGM
jgi:hypothetical protein